MSYDKIKIVVSGANGQLAKEIKYISKKNDKYSFQFFRKNELNICKKKDLNKIFKNHKPDFFINCAAYTNVDKAEEEIDKAFRSNAYALKDLAKVCNEYTCTLIHISTDYVYDNELRRPLKETDPVSPKGIYAKSKHEGELEILKACKKSIIIRSSWIFSSYGSNFVKTMYRLLKDKKQIKVVNDQFGSPTYARDLADLILNKLIVSLIEKSENSMYGVYNYSNEGVTNWYEFAKEIKSLSGLNCEVLPISSGDFKAAAPRPFYSVLDKNKVKNTFSIGDIPHWKNSLAICMLELNN